MARLQQLEGWALKWDDVADRYDFKLKIDKNAFDKSIASGDIQGLLHHSWSQPIARQANGSMQIENKLEGLYVKFMPNDTTAGNDAVKAVMAGDVRGQSVGFELFDIDIEPGKNKQDKPTIIVKQARLDESSIVTMPAMKSSSIKVSQVAPSPELAELRQMLKRD